MSKSNLPLVSVGIITYNSERFIVDAIESVLMQDYPHIEIIIFDDASTDNTVKFIMDYVNRSPEKMKLFINEKNVGAVENWFRCISACPGKYIASLAGDDEFLPGKISKQVAIMERDPAIAICYSNASVFDVLLQKELYRLSDKVPTKSGNIEVALKDAIYYSPTIMFRKAYAPKNNDFPGIKSGADLAFYKEIMILSAPNGKIYYLPEVLYKYKKHNMNITKHGNHKEHVESIKILQKKYPKYSAYLNDSISDFCCVSFFKSLIRFDIKDAAWFLFTGLKAARRSPLSFFRPLIWAVRFKVKVGLKNITFMKKGD